MPSKKTSDKKATQTPKKTPAATPGKTTKKVATSKAFPIVGLGASAGGLEALKAFFSQVPEKTGMAFIVVVHMTPEQPSMLPDLLQTTTPIPVTAAEDDQRIEPDHVYVIPPSKEISVYKGKLQLLDILKKHAVLPIDLFLKSLAQDQGSNAGAIILSGTGTDGTLGIREIKANDGLVLVQDETTAGYNGMPRSAVGTGVVDMVLPPEAMPAKLQQYFTHSRKALFKNPATPDAQQAWQNKIFAILRTQVGHDFSFYKANTILRRIARRMGLNHIDSQDTYVRFLRENPAEVEALFRELLIGVTSFFRDIDSFNVLKASVLPALFDQMGSDATFRAWIPGCSTGEEVYSLGIILRECLEQSGKQIQLQLFGTDIDNHAIEKAREGLFPASIAADVNSERLKRFFIKKGDFYRIHKEIRDYAVFSVQNVIKDPPFSRLSLLCCRNLLIYLNSTAQKRLLPLFHYTLNPDGILMLGSSETIGGHSSLFKTLDKKWKMFKRREVPQALRRMVDFPSGPAYTESTADTPPTPPALQRTEVGQLMQQALLKDFSPAAILVNGKGDMLYVHGRTGRYIEATSGPPTHNILDQAREGLRIELSAALRQAKASADTVTRRRLRVKTNGDTQLIDLHVCPQQAPKELAGHFLVVFEDIDDSSSEEGGEQNAPVASPQESIRITELEKELQITRESHQTTIEELESSNEELKSTNEEMQSSNEELQSTNEELESSKEELQSLNEELQTVNAELQSKLDELSAAQDDMRNLLNSTEIATIFVDNNLRVRRFTPEATDIVNLIQTDVGRPLEHVVSNLDYDQMIADLTEVMAKLTPKEVEVNTPKGNWYNMRIIPYRTVDNRIDGAVMTFSAIKDQKAAQAQLHDEISDIGQAQAMVRAIFDMNSDPLVVLDNKMNMVIANKGYTELMDVNPVDLSGLDFIKSHADISKQIRLKSELTKALKQNQDFKTQAFDVETAAGRSSYNLHGRIIETEMELPYRILLHFEKEG